MIGLHNNNTNSRIEELDCIVRCNQYEYNINDVTGDLLTSFSICTHSNIFDIHKFENHKKHVAKISLFLGPRSVSTINVHLTENRKMIPFFRQEKPLMLPKFLLKKWPMKIIVECPVSAAQDNPRIFAHTDSLVKSSRKMIRLQDIKIDYWPHDSIALHQLRLIHGP